MFLLWCQLVDGHTLFDYNVGLNEIIQILVRKPISAAGGAETVTDGDAGQTDDVSTGEPPQTTTASESLSVS